MFHVKQFKGLGRTQRVFRLFTEGISSLRKMNIAPSQTFTCEGAEGLLAGGAGQDPKGPEGDHPICTERSEGRWGIPALEPRILRGSEAKVLMRGGQGHLPCAIGAQFEELL